MRDMKLRQRLLLFMLCLSQGMMGQLTSLGLVEESNIENSGELVIDTDIKTVVYGGLHCKKGGKLVIR